MRGWGSVVILVNIAHAAFWMVLLTYSHHGLFGGLWQKVGWMMKEQMKMIMECEPLLFLTLGYFPLPPPIHGEIMRLLSLPGKLLYFLPRDEFEETCNAFLQESPGLRWRSVPSRRRPARPRRRSSRIAAQRQSGHEISSRIYCGRSFVRSPDRRGRWLLCLSAI